MSCGSATQLAASLLGIRGPDECRGRDTTHRNHRDLARQAFMVTWGQHPSVNVDMVATAREEGSKPRKREIQFFNGAFQTAGLRCNGTQRAAGKSVDPADEWDIEIWVIGKGPGHASINIGWETAQLAVDWGGGTHTHKEGLEKGRV
ncbi:hypothetical protein B0H14DRAFT_2579520 [Mycena olivaceomarginata]|nr:hypothetical protein B0H14DRAFT_2579520 [Mycena olivaceomarginata]